MVLATIIDRCLKKDPAERYQSAREILAEQRSAAAEAKRRRGKWWQVWRKRGAIVLA